MSILPKILVVDDDPDIVEILRYNLSLAGYEVKSAANGKEAIKTSLDNTMIIFLSARSEDFTQIAAFDAGGDDYISKPVKPKILLKKIASILKRINYENNKTLKLELDNLVIDRNEYKIVKDKQDLTLPRKQFELLFLLASKPGKVFTRDEIMNSVWGSQVIVGDRTIDVHIRKLREKIGDSYFKTIKGVGYKFTQ